MGQWRGKTPASLIHAVAHCPSSHRTWDLSPMEMTTMLQEGPARVGTAHPELSRTTAQSCPHLGGLRLSPR